MIKKIKVKNFRSIKEKIIEIAPLTLFYGPNGGGKSSLLYAPFVFKNIILNPNQSIDGFFNFMFVNFGGFEQVVHLHNLENNIEIEIGIVNEENNYIYYGVSLEKKEGKFWLKFPQKLDLSLKVTFPYAGGLKQQQTVKINETDVNILWNGITASVSAQPITSEQAEAVNKFLTSLNSCSEILRKLDIVPCRRGFSKPHYSPSQMALLLTEDEIATLLAANPYLEGQVMRKCEKIFDNKKFGVRVQLGTSLFFLHVIDEWGVTNELINDGFGLNQTIYMLTKICRPEVSLIFIEEPEIHLHPSAQAKLARVFAEIVKEENKCLIIETHSETIVSTFLSLVAEKTLKPEDIKCYLITKPKKETVIEEQKINEKGQIEGGLIPFMEEEIKNILALLKTKKDT